MIGPDPNIEWFLTAVIAGMVAGFIAVDVRRFLASRNASRKVARGGVGSRGKNKSKSKRTSKIEKGSYIDMVLRSAYPKKDGESKADERARKAGADVVPRPQPMSNENYPKYNVTVEMSGSKDVEIGAVGETVLELTPSKPSQPPATPTTQEISQATSDVPQSAADSSVQESDDDRQKRLLKKWSFDAAEEQENET